MCVAKTIAAESAIPEQLRRGCRESPRPIDYLEPRCVNYLDHSHTTSDQEGHTDGFLFPARLPPVVRLDHAEPADGRQAVAEIGRVLKPGGRLLFLEHGLSSEDGIQRWQHRLAPLQKWLADGCRLDLDLEALIRSGAFREVRIERFLLEGMPKIVGSMYRGFASR
jgi:SAM-dependent methyltransferase